MAVGQNAASPNTNSAQSPLSRQETKDVVKEALREQRRQAGRNIRRSANQPGSRTIYVPTPANSAITAQQIEDAVNRAIQKGLTGTPQPAITIPAVAEVTKTDEATKSFFATPFAFTPVDVLITAVIFAVVALIGAIVWWLLTASQRQQAVIAAVSANVRQMVTVNGNSSGAQQPTQPVVNNYYFVHACSGSAVAMPNGTATAYPVAAPAKKAAPKQPVAKPQSEFVSTNGSSAKAATA